MAGVAGCGDCFAIRLTAAGGLVWAAHTVGPSKDGDSCSGGAGAHAVAVDEDGNVYTAGIYQNTVDFDPGPASHSLVAGVNFQHAFVAREFTGREHGSQIGSGRVVVEGGVFGGHRPTLFFDTSFVTHWVLPFGYYTVSREIINIG